ncbi:MAG: hypothetical protein MHPSP_002506, partial [Paramarteilia canceri]
RVSDLKDIESVSKNYPLVSRFLLINENLDHGLLKISQTNSCQIKCDSESFSHIHLDYDRVFDNKTSLGSIFSASLSNLCTKYTQETLNQLAIITGLNDNLSEKIFSGPKTSPGIIYRVLKKIIPTNSKDYSDFVKYSVSSTSFQVNKTWLTSKVANITLNEHNNSNMSEISNNILFFSVFSHSSEKSALLDGLDLRQNCEKDSIQKVLSIPAEDFQSAASRIRSALNLLIQKNIENNIIFVRFIKINLNQDCMQKVMSHQSNDAGSFLNIPQSFISTFSISLCNWHTFDDFMEFNPTSKDLPPRMKIPFMNDSFNNIAVIATMPEATLDLQVANDSLCMLKILAINSISLPELTPSEVPNVKKSITFSQKAEKKSENILLQESVIPEQDLHKILSEYDQNNQVLPSKLNTFQNSVPNDEFFENYQLEIETQLESTKSLLGHFLALRPVVE